MGAIQRHEHQDARFSDALSFEGVVSRIQWSVKLWVPYSCETERYSRYRGISEFTISLENLLGSSVGEKNLSLRFYGGGKSYINPAKGGQELTFRLRPGGIGF